jgi:HNH endonuclease
MSANSKLSRDVRQGAVREYAAGKSALSVGKEIGVSHHTIIAWAKAAGVKIKTLTESRRLRIASADERFDSRYIKRPTGCWEWIGGRDRGYGHFRAPSNIGVGAHRYSYVRAKGAIPEGMEIDHLCRNPACVNPDHLEAVPHLVNIQRSKNANRHKTVCKRGHEFVPENTGYHGGAHRYCKECERQRRAAQRAARC